MIQSSPPIGRQDVGLHGLEALRQRSHLIAACSAAGLAIGALSYMLQPPRYVAEAVIALDGRRIQSMPVDQVVTPLPQENPVLRTELDRISSRVMAQRVIDKLAAEGGEPFEGNASGPPIRIAQPARGGMAGWLGRLRGNTAPKQQDPRSALEARLRANLDVVNDGRSYTIYIAYSADDAALAARVANAYARAYLDYQDDVQIEATRRVSDWLEVRLATLGAKLQQAEQNAERFKASSGLFEMGGVTIAAQRVSALSAELITARAAKATAEARERTAALLSTRQDGLDGFSDVLGSPIIQQLRVSQSQLERRLQVLRDTGASQSVEIPVLTSELQTVRQQIDREVEHILVSLRNEIDTAARRVTSIEGQLRAAEADYGGSDTARVKLEGLVREANADRAVYESLLGRAKQIGDRKELTDPGVRLISEATVPARPSNPRLLPTMLLGLLSGAGVGVCLALLLGRLDPRVRSRHALEAATGVPVLATIPTLPRRAGREPASQIVQDPRSAFAEAFATLQWMLRLSPAMRRAGVLMVTSALPGEGKTTLALSLARSMARSGRSVVLVDADLHGQSVALMAGAATADDHRGLAAYLSGDLDLEQVVVPDPETPLQLIIARGMEEEKPSLLADKRLAMLIAALRDRFDAVILDTPAILASSDAAQIGAHADAVLFVARWGWTPFESVTASIERLAFCGQTVRALVLNRVSMRVHRSFERPGSVGRAPATPPARPPAASDSPVVQMREA
ncbi:polysaccharide biosynthesis protein [Kaistia sp. 32K]|uniref:GumC family protein n=1 Tax=Kaistia sp. 32K TaxID=2795690 RepID=UPI00191577C5|nr:P-loop NTPase [Kaistia sp. 32K]BCP53477.1 polysaccharide biosynthesis protein [Kaistia sp. 32K]